MPDEIEGYEKGNIFCKIFKQEQHMHYGLVKHYHKYHKNKASFVCNKYGRGFFQAEGHHRHVESHNLDQKIKSLDIMYTHTFTLELISNTHLLRD